MKLSFVLGRGNDHTVVAFPTGRSSIRQMVVPGTYKVTSIYASGRRGGQEIIFQCTPSADEITVVAGQTTTLSFKVPDSRASGSHP